MQIICTYCGKKFEAYPSENRKFCSQDCFRKAIKAGIVKLHRFKPKRGKVNPSWKGGRITITCAVCGKLFKIFPSREGIRKYCSNKCRAIAVGKRRKGKIDKWQKGRYKSNSGYIMLKISHLSEQEQKLARQMTNGAYIQEHRLIMAKMLGRALKRDEFAHHKDENRANNAEENLELRTPSSHAKDIIISPTRKGKCPICGHIDEIRGFLNAVSSL